MLRSRFMHRASRRAPSAARTRTRAAAPRAPPHFRRARARTRTRRNEAASRGIIRK